MSDDPRPPAPPAGRPGRPPSPAPAVPVSSRLAPTDYDALARAASRHGVSVSAFVRGALLAALRPPRR